MAALPGRAQAAEVHWISVISIIIPVFCEAENIASLRQSTEVFRSLGAEVIIVDGGSDDGTEKSVAALADQFVVASQGRSNQMNAGANLANGEVLLFLHADTVLSEAALTEASKKIEDSEWGRFDLRIDNTKFLYRVIECLINLRSKLTGIATGDQAIFIRTKLFQEIGGYADTPLMEDVEICRRLKARVSPICLPQKVLTSARYWEKHGPITSIFRMWRLRFAYWLGVSPERLYDQYYREIAAPNND